VGGTPRVGFPPPYSNHAPMGTLAWSSVSRWKRLPGEGRRLGVRGPGGAPGSIPRFFSPAYFLILLVQVFQKCVQLVLVNEATPVLDNEGGTSAGQKDKRHRKPNLGMGAGGTPSP